MIKGIILSLLCSILISPLFAQSLGSDRVAKIKANTVQILINGTRHGTGFFFNKESAIATATHVLYETITQDDTHLTINENVSIEAVTNEFDTLSLYVDLVHFKSLHHAIHYDISILRPLEIQPPRSNLFKLGSFNDTAEGEWVYTCGFPWEIRTPFLSSGIVSSITRNKEVDKHYNGITISAPRNDMWIDMTVNPGNSGGPIIRVGNSLDEDVIVGVVSYILNPFIAEALELQNNKGFSRLNFIVDGQYSLNDEILRISNSLGRISIGVSGGIDAYYLSPFIE